MECFVGRSIRRTLRKMAVEISSAASELGSVQAFETLSSYSAYFAIIRTQWQRL